MLIGWCCFAAAVLILSLVVHDSTFLRIDPTAPGPGAMLLHLAVFPPFIAAIVYANQIARKNPEFAGRVLQAAPLWLRVLTGALFGYAILNLILVIMFCEGGVPIEQGGKYLLTNDEKVLRELTAAEYHRQRTYVARGFSAHWMLFSSAALMALVGASSVCRRSAKAAASAD